MIQLNLTAEEAAMLAEVLKSYLSDLRMEIGGTDLMSFREMLKHRERFLAKLLGQLPQEQTS